MTSPTPPPYVPGQPQVTGHFQTPPPKKKSKLPWILGGVGLALALCLGGVVAIGLAADGVDSPAPGNVAADVKTAAPAAEQPAAEPPKPKTPTAKDFKLSVKTLKKECFGSAGCLVNYRIEVTFAGDPLALDASRTYEVTYDVKGAEDPITNTFTITGEQVEVEREEMTQTSKSSAKLTAVATSVTEM